MSGGEGGGREGGSAALPLRLTWAALTWVTYQVAVIPLWLLGWIATPLAIRYGQWERSPITGAWIYNAPRWLWLWGNDEDGLDPAWYQLANPTWGPFKRMLIWNAWRNSVNNLRCVLWLHPAPVAERIRCICWAGGTDGGWLRGGWLCWQGVLYCIQLQTRWGEFTCGWRYYPEDAQGVDPSDWRCWGCGFRVSWLRDGT